MLELPRGRISGAALSALVAAVRRTPAKHAVAHVLRAELGIAGLGDASVPRRPVPQSNAPLAARTNHERESQSLPLPAAGDWPRSSAALLAAYRAGSASPPAVVEAALAGARFLAAQVPSRGPLLDFDDARALAAARESAERIASGTARPLEGIPVAIKEEVQVEGLPARVGTSWMPRRPSAADCVAVARLRAQGAVVLGTTPMTEYGMSPLGGNVHRVMPRNAHDPDRLPGGSSSGSGVAVATGIVPMALGVDGGGSIRIPACLNGVFGLKPSFGRIPATGHGLDGGSTVGHLGPIAATSHDLALFLQAAAGADAGDPASHWQTPLPDVIHALGRGVRGLRIGIVESEWKHAPRDVAAPAEQALALLEREGAILVPVALPNAHHAAPVGYLTIGLETYAGVADARRDHMDELGLDMQMLIANLSTFGPDDYLDAQRVRSAIREQTAKVLADVDVLALPTTASAAPPVSDSDEKRGFVDPPALDAMCRFAFLANLTGLPAGTAPIGTDGDGLPVGLQILGDAWDEAAVLQVLAHLERTGAAVSRRPRSYVDVLLP